MRQRILQISCFLLCFYILSPRYVFSLPKLSLDPSWMLTMAYVFDRGFSFGKDVVFTYGPLSFLATRIVLNSMQEIWIIGMQLTIAGSIAFLMAKYLWASIKSKNYILTVALIASFLILPMATLDVSIILLLIYIGFTTTYFWKAKSIFLWIAASIAALSFFIKISTGLILFAHLTAVYFYLGLKLPLSSVIKQTFPLLCSLIAVYIIAFLTNVSIPEYVSYSVEVIRGYNEANALLPDSFFDLFLALSIILLAITFLGHRAIKSGRILSPHVASMLTVLFGLYLIFKLSFVRADFGHVNLFFTYSLFFILFSVQPATLVSGNLAGRGIILLIALISVTWFLNENKANNVKLITKPPFAQVFSDYRRQIDSAYSTAAAARNLPNRVHREINRSTVDILPWETTFVLYNGFNYKPRPVFQSYQAYTPILDSLNAAFYQSAHAPDYLLFSNCTIDNRNPFWEETRTKLTILKNYDIKDRILLDNSIHVSFVSMENPAELYLFKRNPGVRNLELVRTETLPMPSDFIVPIPESENILMLEMKIGDKLLGRLRKLFFQPAIVEAILYVDEDWTERFRAYRNTFEDGVIVNKAVLDSDAAAKFLSGNLQNVPSVKKVKFYFDKTAEWVKAPASYTLREYRIVQSDKNMFPK